MLRDSHAREATQRVGACRRQILLSVDEDAQTGFERSAGALQIARCIALRTGLGKRLRPFKLDFGSVARCCRRTIEVAAGPASSDFGIARFTSGGVLDQSFDTDGKLLVDFFGASDAPTDVLVQPDGKIIAAGVARNGSSRGLGLVRVVP